MNERSIIISDFKIALKEAMFREWRAQGHAMSSAMTHLKIESVDKRVSLEISVYGAPYYGYVNKGVKASQIPFRAGSGAGHSLYIEALTRYAERRMGLSGREALSVAFAIAKTQKRQGMPTRNSYSYSSTGRRTGFIEEMLKNEKRLFDTFAGKLFDQIIEETVDVMFKSTNKI